MLFDILYLYLNSRGAHFRSALNSRNLNLRTLNTIYTLSYEFAHLVKQKMYFQSDKYHKIQRILRYHVGIDKHSFMTGLTAT